jgi:hypothetical protein
MKRAISVRKATLMIATVRNTSLAERGLMNASHLAKPREYTIQARKCFGSKRKRDVCGMKGVEIQDAVDVAPCCKLRDQFA